MLDTMPVQCPWCGERFEAVVDASAGDAEYVEDCQVCCRPIVIRLQVDDDGGARGLQADRED